MLAVHNPKRLLAICESELQRPFGSAFTVAMLLRLSLERPECFVTEEEYKNHLNAGGETNMT